MAFRLQPPADRQVVPVTVTPPADDRADDAYSFMPARGHDR